MWQSCHVSKYGIPTSDNPVRHRCETSVRGNFSITDKIMPPDSEDPSLTFHVKGFNGFHVTGEQGPVWYSRCYERRRINPRCYVNLTGAIDAST